jgi:hypothetical protein
MKRPERQRLVISGLVSGALDDDALSVFHG